jgi:hypothetical protein
MTHYKNRRIDRKRAVEVYRNLHRGGYSIRQDHLVVAHTTAVMIKDAAFVVNRAGHARMLRERVRNVHAWVRGLLIDSGMGTTPEEAKSLPVIRYDRQRGRFMTDICTPSKQIHGAMVVALNDRGAFAAYMH